jgi:hypothetical protein
VLFLTNDRRHARRDYAATLERLGTGGQERRPHLGVRGHSSWLDAPDPLSRLFLKILRRTIGTRELR